MQSNNKVALGITMLLAGCAGGGGHADDPRIADPSAPVVGQPYDPAPQPYPSAGQADRPADRQPDDALQGDYPPEPGAPSYRDRAAPPPRAAPGVGYARPGTRQVQPYRDPPSGPADMPAAVAASTGPRGTSGEQQRYDAVGYASWYGEEMGEARTSDGRPFDPSAITAAHRTLPLGSIVEITALDTGRTILALVNDRGPGGRDREIDMSRGAAQALGLTAALAPVRVRLVNASPPDVSALRLGRSAGQRIDAPPALLTALRRRLPARSVTPVAQPRPSRSMPGAGYGVRPTPSRPMPASPMPPWTTASRVTAGIFVQVAALSSESRAQALATSLGGRVARVGAIYRVQIGPYANTASAQRARDDVARRGYGDARIVTTN